MTIYDRLRTTTVPRLLSKYNTGVVEVGVTTLSEPLDPWDPPTETTVWTQVDAVVTGVSQRYVDNENIVMSDREVIMQNPASYDAEAGSMVRIDGKVVAVLQVMPILAAGEAAMTRLVVRG